MGKVSIGIAPQAGLDVGFGDNNIAVGLSILQSPLLLCTIKLSEIVDTCICRGSNGFTNKVWHCYRCEKSNNND